MKIENAKYYKLDDTNENVSINCVTLMVLKWCTT